MVCQKAEVFKLEQVLLAGMTSYDTEPSLNAAGRYATACGCALQLRKSGSDTQSLTSAANPPVLPETLLCLNCARLSELKAA